MSPRTARGAGARTTLTAALKPLERRSLVEITKDPVDQHGRIMALTAEGRHLLARAVPIWRRTRSNVDSLLAEVGTDRLREGLLALSTSDRKTAAVDTIQGQGCP